MSPIKTPTTARVIEIIEEELPDWMWYDKYAIYFDGTLQVEFYPWAMTMPTPTNGGSVDSLEQFREELAEELENLFQKLHEHGPNLVLWEYLENGTSEKTKVYQMAPKTMKHHELLVVEHKPVYGGELSGPVFKAPATISIRINRIRLRDNYLHWAATKMQNTWYLYIAEEEYELAPGF